MKYPLILVFVSVSHSCFSQADISDTVNYYWPSGSLKSQSFNSKGPGWGWINTWYENGTLKSRQTLRDGQETGYQAEWYPNGNYRYEHHLTGCDTVLDVDTLTGRSSYTIGKSGRMIDYYENGFRKQDGHFLECRRTGKWSFWRNDGILSKEEWYERGEVSSYNHYLEQ